MLLTNGVDAASLHPFDIIAIGYFQKSERRNVTHMAGACEMCGMADDTAGRC
jgi:hypothetical protein